MPFSHPLKLAQVYDEVSGLADGACLSLVLEVRRRLQLSQVVGELVDVVSARRTFDKAYYRDWVDGLHNCYG
jgi:hypothetical protein